MTTPHQQSPAGMHEQHTDQAKKITPFFTWRIVIIRHCRSSVTARPCRRGHWRPWTRHGRVAWSTSTKDVHGIYSILAYWLFSCFIYDPISLMTLRARSFNYCSADIWFYYGLAIEKIMSWLSWVVTLIVFPLFFYLQIYLKFNIFNFDHRIR
jgi:hypothetical protein